MCTELGISNPEYEVVDSGADYTHISTKIRFKNCTIAKEILTSNWQNLSPKMKHEKQKDRRKKTLELNTVTLWKTRSKKQKENT